MKSASVWRWARNAGMLFGWRCAIVVVGRARRGLGLATALATTRLISAQLFDLAPTDPLTITSATLLLLAVATLAGYLPARKAAQTDPMLGLFCGMNIKRTTCDLNARRISYALTGKYPKSEMGRLGQGYNLGANATEERNRIAFDI